MTVAEFDAGKLGRGAIVQHIAGIRRGVAVATARPVDRHTSGMAVSSERRGAAHADRRKRSRSGRRGTDPNEGRRRGFRVAWMFAGYLLYASARALAAMVRRVRRT